MFPVSPTTVLTDLAFPPALCRASPMINSAASRSRKPRVSTFLSSRSFVDREEVFDLGEQSGTEVVEAQEVRRRRIAERDAQGLVILSLLISHPEDSDRSRGDPASREGWLSDENESIERIAILSQRPLDEPVVGRVSGRREEHPVEVDEPAVVVHLVLVPGSTRDLHDDRHACWVHVPETIVAS
jgi:hypothetical protein